MSVKNGKLIIITASNDEASKVYVGKKIKYGESLGYNVQQVNCMDNQVLTSLIGPKGRSTTIAKDLAEGEQHTLINRIRETISNANKSPDVAGILLQLPLDDSIKEFERELIDIIDPYKDVDCLTTYNQGKIMTGCNNGYLPCTTDAVIEAITNNCRNGDLRGERVHVVGRSVLVTKPLIVELINRGATVVNWNSNNYGDQIMESVMHDANVFRQVHFVSGIGQPHYFDFSIVENDYLKFIHIYDIGINVVYEGKIVGDVRPYSGAETQTPVPGGIGPKTVRHVFSNLRKLISAKHR